MNESTYTVPLCIPPLYKHSFSMQVWNAGSSSVGLFVHCTFFHPYIKKQFKLWRTRGTFEAGMVIYRTSLNFRGVCIMWCINHFASMLIIYYYYYNYYYCCCYNTCKTKQDKQDIVTIIIIIIIIITTTITIIIPTIVNLNCPTLIRHFPSESQQRYAGPYAVMLNGHPVPS